MTQPLRILVIDDNPGDRALVIRQLQREFTELTVEEVRELSELENAVAAGKFDLVITDYQLHWSNGLEVLRTVKQHYPNCPVIMFTNTGSEEIAVEAMKLELDDYVLKQPNRYIRIPVTVRAALERVEMQRRTAILEIRLQGLLDQLKVGVFRFNSLGIIESNKAFLDLLGADSLVQAQSILPLNLQESYSQLLDMSQPQQQECEVELHRADGTLIWVLISITSNTIEGETVVDSLIEDISSRKQAEIAKQQLNETLEQRVSERTQELELANRQLAVTNEKLAVVNQDLEEFSYMVSHDLREPLRSITGFSTMLLKNEGKQPHVKQEEYLHRILASAEQSTKLIQDLLRYSRLNRSEIEMRSLNLSLLIPEILWQLDSTLKQRQAKIMLDEPLGEVTANYTILTQVISNLLTNATKFVAPEVKPQVRFRTESRGELIRLWIEDNGIGINPEYHKQIFNVFKRLHNNDIYPGTGIGLAIVRKGIERMGGQVGVESELGQGSRFWIDLPKARE
jgi:PAS domain S-box-containing protein